MNESLNEEIIKSFVTRNECLQSMPETSIRILHLLTDPNFRMDRLLRLIEQDAAIAARIIQVVNSAAYARTNRITQLNRAAVYLGVNTIKEIAAATAVGGICKPAVIGQYSMKDLWDHSVGVAVLAREFARHVKSIDPELAFLAGILHDVGLLLSVQAEVSTAEEIFIDAADGKIPFSRVEKGYFGFDHCELGRELAIAWRFPEEVLAVITSHHAPRTAPASYQQLCWNVFLADTLCSNSGVGFPLTCILQKADDTAFGEAGLDRNDAKEVLARFKVLLRLHLD